MYLFYVYAYLRRDGTPYYIGKGKRRRAYEKHKNISTPLDRSCIVFLETNLTEIGALALERRIIKWYGRKDLDTGILRNMTDGGEGTSGIISPRKGLPLPEETKRKMRGRVTSEETKALISSIKKGKQHSAESRSKMASAKKGISRSIEVIEQMKTRIQSEETKAKISASMKNRWKGSYGL